MRTKGEQLTFAFMDGGMVDSGKEVEATTGNDIPPGSLPEEVADTVDAKLSEGEYVLPADVVQFYGMEKIENWVNKAKEKLSELDADGRIGGEPQGDIDEDLPLSDKELMDGEELEMAQGGFVPPSNSGVQNKVYVGPNGERRTVLFFNEQPIQAVPAGYTPEAERSNQKKKTNSLDPAAKNKALDRDSPDSGTPSTTPVSEWSVEDFTDFASKGDNMGKAAMAAAMAIGGPLAGYAVKAGLQHQGKSVKAEIESRLTREDLSPQDREKLGKALEGLGKASQEKEGIFGGIFDDAKDNLSKIGDKIGSFFGKEKGASTPAPTVEKAAPSAPQAGPSSSAAPAKGDGENSQGRGGYMAKGGLVKRRK